MKQWILSDLLEVKQIEIILSFKYYILNGYKISFLSRLVSFTAKYLFTFDNVYSFKKVSWYFFENNVAILTLNKFKFIHTCVDRHSDVKRFLKDDIDQGYAT